MYSLHDLYDADVDRKIALSHVLYDSLPPRIKDHASVRQSRAKLLALAEHCRQVMSGMQIFNLCTVCGNQPQGGCCSAGMANESDTLLLLINLLAGQKVAVQRNDGFECRFLGASGCALLFKPMFCLNYNCRKIKSAAKPSALKQLEQATGQLLQEQYHMEQLLLERLRRANLLS